MKKKVARTQKSKVFEDKDTDFEMTYRAIQEFFEAMENEREKEEKERLLKQLNEVTKNKEIVLSNYVRL